MRLGLDDGMRLGLDDGSPVGIRDGILLGVMSRHASTLKLSIPVVHLRKGRRGLGIGKDN
jgi:hypothetical protein